MLLLLVCLAVSVGQVSARYQVCGIQNILSANNLLKNANQLAPAALGTLFRNASLPIQQGRRISAVTPIGNVFFRGKVGVNSLNYCNVSARVPYLAQLNAIGLGGGPVYVTAPMLLSPNATFYNYNRTFPAGYSVLKSPVATFRSKPLYVSLPSLKRDYVYEDIPDELSPDIAFYSDGVGYTDCFYLAVKNDWLDQPFDGEVTMKVSWIGIWPECPFAGQPWSDYEGATFDGYGNTWGSVDY